jgi:hypothetical protein
MCIEPLGSIPQRRYTLDILAETNFNFMKTLSNIFISHLILLILFGGAALALAQSEEVESEETPSSESVETSGENADTEETSEEQAGSDTSQSAQGESQAERQETRRANLDEQARQRITNLAALMSNRIEAVIARMANITSRLDSRIQKMEDRGLDVTEAQLTLDSARLSLEEAELSISNIDQLVSNTVGAEDVRVAWQEIKALFINVRDQLKTAQLELRNTVSALNSAPAVDSTEDPDNEEVESNSNPS